MHRLIRSALPFVATAALTVVGYAGYRMVRNERLTGVDRPPNIAGCDLVQEGERWSCRVWPFSPDESTTLVVWIEDEDLSERGVEVTLHTLWKDLDQVFEHNALWPKDREGAGTQLVIQVTGEGVLEISGIVEGEPRRWAVEIEARPATPGYDAVYLAWDPEGPSVYQEAIARVLEVIAQHSDDAWTRDLASMTRAQILRTNLPAAISAYQQALEQTDETERSIRCLLRRDLLELHVTAGQYADAEAALAGMDAEACDELGLDHTHRRALQEGALYLEQARHAEAIARLKEAVRGAERMIAPRIELVAKTKLAIALGRMQLPTHAARMFEAATKLATKPEVQLTCNDWLSFANIAADLAISRRLGRRPIGFLPTELLEQVLGFGCPLSSIESTRLMFSRAYVELLLGRLDAAAAALDQAEDVLGRAAQGQPDAEAYARLQKKDWMYAASIRGEIAIARKDRSALAAAYEKLDALLGESASEADAGLLMMRNAFAARLAGKRDDLSLGRTDLPPGLDEHEALTAAKAHLIAAFLQQEQLLRLGLLGLSASRVAAKAAEIGRLLLEVQLQLHDPAGALCTARLLHNRDMRLLADAARVMSEHPELVAAVRAAASEYRGYQTGWPTGHYGDPNAVQRAKEAMERASQDLVLAFPRAADPLVPTYDALCAALPEPVEGERAVLFHQDPAGHWWIFDWARDEPIRMPHDGGPAELPTAPEEQVARFLAPLRERLDSAKRIRLLASGALDEVEFEGLPWDGSGTTLEQRFYVTWGLDLPSPSHSTTAPAQPMRNVVVCSYPKNKCESLGAGRFARLRAALERTWKDAFVFLLDDGASLGTLTELSNGAFLVLIGHNTSLAELDLSEPRCAGLDAMRDLDELDPLAGGLMIDWTTMDLGAIITLPSPRVAVFESCATSPFDAPSAGGVIGLANVLAATGPEQVLATRGKVCIEDSYEFVATLVEATKEHGYDLPVVLRAIRAEADPRYERRVLAP